MHRNHWVESYRKDETLRPMIEENVPMGKRHDNFHERFMEKRILKLNKPERLELEDSFQSPIEQLRTVPTALPRKRISNTASHSEVIFAQVLSPAKQVTPDSSHASQPYLMPSTSWIDPVPDSPSRYLTSIQQFISNSRKFRKKEPKLPSTYLFGAPNSLSHLHLSKL